MARMLKEADIRKLLDDGIWPDDLDPKESYRAVQDDDDGTGKGYIQVSFGPDGDAWVTTDRHGFEGMRFRTDAGGARNHHVRNALILLAYAVRMKDQF